jgi:hypothetical protein
MTKKFPVLVVALFSLASAVQAAVNFDDPEANNFTDEISNAAAVVPAPEAAGIKPSDTIKDWTIMVFINAKNNLEKFGLKDMNEMEMVGSSDRVNVVVEIGRMEGFPVSYNYWKGTRRYLIEKDTDTANVTSPVVQSLGETDMGDYRSVISFGKWAKSAYPAKKTMLIIWNHGSGWVKSDKSLDGVKGISYDDATGSHINTPQMGTILKEIGGVDIYGSDACLMQMAEVVYETKDSARYIIGSEESEPGDGYTYNTLLAPLVANPDMKAEELSRVVVESYSDHYRARNKGSTQSYIRASAVRGFLGEVNEFVSAIITAGEKDLVRKAMSAARSYAYSESKDLYHFTKLVVKDTRNPAVLYEGFMLMNYIEKQLVGCNRTTNSAGGEWGSANYSKSRGISIYLPSSAPTEGYNELMWSRDSRWDEFIKWYQED